MIDCDAQLIIVMSQDGFAPRCVSKYRPAVPQLVVTTQDHVANQACAAYGQYPVKVSRLYVWDGVGMRAVGRRDAGAAHSYASKAWAY